MRVIEHNDLEPTGTQFARHGVGRCAGTNNSYIGT